jgi:SAM-dependent methyltransferase
MDSLLSRIEFRSILDCPFGTGRWIPQYDAVGAHVIGVDMSSDMLSQARAKIPAAEQPRYTLIRGSIFELDDLKLAASPDLVVCVRFLNWIPLHSVRKAIEQLSSLGSRHLIVGCSIRPQESAFASLGRRLALHLSNLRNRGNPRQHVHDECAFEAVMREAGWKLRDTEFVFRLASGMGFLFLYERMKPPAI